MILPQHSDDKKYDDNKHDDNKYGDNQYDDNKYGLMTSWPHSGWSRPALVASLLSEFDDFASTQKLEYHNKSQLIIMIFPNLLKDQHLDIIKTIS